MVFRGERRWLGKRGGTTAVADVEAADPENDVFGDVGGVVGDAFEMARGQDELEAGAHERGLLGHALKKMLENAVAVLIDHVVAFENLRGHFDVAKNESTEAPAV